MSQNLVIKIRVGSSGSFTIGSSQHPILTSSSTILQTKQVICNQSESENCPVDRQRLIHKGRILSDDSRTLGDYAIVDCEQSIHLVKGRAPAAPSSPAVASNNTFDTLTGTLPSPPSPFASMGMGMNNNSNSNTNSNPFAAMGGMGGGMDVNQMQQMQQDLMQNPEAMSNLMNSPMMQNLMSNPDFMRNMMDSNPQMRQMLDNNPELRHVLDDPDLMRRSMEMMRDPNAMQNMMRNNDLAMSQIENIPGGFAALRRMYEDVQEPMMDAMGGDGGSSSSASEGNSNRSSANAGSGAAGTAMPNPWASSASTYNANASTGTGQIPNMFGNMGGAGAAAAAGAPNPWAGVNTGAGGMGEMPNMNIEQTLNMLENPMVNQMMNQMMSDPSAMQAMMDSNPMLRQLRETNPQMASMMSNPETIRAMLNPSNLRSMMQMQQAMGQLSGNVPGFPAMPGGPGGFPNTNTNANPFAAPPAGNPGMDFSSLLNQMQSASVSANSAPRTAEVPPEQRFRLQLQSLNDMGFDDNPINISALLQTHGNVNRAIDVLLTDPPAPHVSVQPSAPSPAPSTSSVQSSNDNSNIPENQEPKPNEDKKND